MIDQQAAEQSTLRRFLAKSVSGTFGAKIFNMGLVYLNSLLLVRLIGADGYGEYALLLSWLQILLIPAAFGFEGLIGRELAVYTVRQKWPRARGLLAFSSRWVLGMSMLLAVVGFVGLQAAGLTTKLSAPYNLAIALGALPFLALSRLRGAALQSLRQVVVGQLPEMVIRPGLILLGLGLLWAVGAAGLTATGAITVNLLATAAAFAVGAWFLQARLTPETKRANAELSPRPWLTAALPMLLIGSMYVINGQTDSVMLGMFQDTRAVGLYTVANRGASLVGFASIAFAASLSPVFASLYAEGNRTALRRAFKQGCQSAFAISLVLALVLALFSRQFLGLFGPEFLQSQGVLFLLMAGNLINSFAGATPVLLNMTGFARDTVVGVSASAIANIFLNAWLIPRYGIEGAAMATAISMVLWNVLLIGFTYRRFGFWATAIPIPAGSRFRGGQDR